MPVYGGGGGGSAGSGAWIVDLDPWFSDGTNVGTWALGASAAIAPGGWRVYNSSLAQNDLFDYPKVQLDAGTYTFEMLTTTGPGYATATVLLDAVSIGTLDLYSAGAVYNVTKTITGIVIATSGSHHVQIKAATKNASSTNWEIDLCALRLVRTA